MTRHVRFPVKNFVSSQTLTTIWQTLKAAPRSGLSTERRLHDLAQKSWLTAHEVEDLIEAMDHRIGVPDFDLITLSELAGVPMRALTQRPRSRFDDPLGIRAVSAVDTCTILIMLERLGFSVDAEALCQRLRPYLKIRDQVTFEEIDVIFYDKARHRLPALRLEVNPSNRQLFGTSRHTLKTPVGYRVELETDDSGTPVSLTTYAPKYRKRPQPVLSTCVDCGMSYVKGMPSEDSSHRSSHKAWKSVQQPEPDNKLIDALANEGEDAAWVDWLAEPWKRKLVLGRARAFRREGNYDFVQWEESGWADEEALGYLFIDEPGRAVGACCFRPEAGTMESWRLDWIWLAPEARRTGILRKSWPMFRERFGDFRIVAPVSDAMAAFLAAMQPDAKLR